MRRPQRAAVDDRVDRPQVEAQRCVEPSGTNCPRACAAPPSGARAHPPPRGAAGGPVCGTSRRPDPKPPFLPPPGRRRTRGGYCAGAHLFPFRTEKLSPAAPMILHHCGKVGRRPPLTEKAHLSMGFFCFLQQIFFLFYSLCFPFFSIFALKL